MDKDEKKKIRNDLKKGKFIAITPPDYSQPVAADYPDCLEIVESDVKPERLEKNDKVARERWWLFARLRKELKDAINGLEVVMVLARVSKFLSVSNSSSKNTFSDQIFVLVTSNISDFLIFQNSFHDIWAWKTSSTMGGTTIRYSGTDTFETYPFPQNLTQNQQEILERIGHSYHEYRRQLMQGLQLGLTKTYNLFHSAELATLTDDTLRELSKEEEKQLTKRAGKEGLTLYKHLLRTPEATLSFNEAVRQVAELRRLHVEMDNAVLEAYGWSDIHLRHDFYEVDYLPENDRVRYTLHPEARAEVLKRLLALNHRLHAEEEAAREAAKKAGKKPTKAKALSAPASVATAPVATATTTQAAPQLAAEEKASYQKTTQSLLEVTSPLFGSAARPSIIAERSRVTLTTEGKTLRLCLLKGINEGGFSGSYQNIRLDSPLAKALLGHKVGEKVEFGGKVYEVLGVE